MKYSYLSAMECYMLIFNISPFDIMYILIKKAIRYKSLPPFDIDLARLCTVLLFCSSVLWVLPTKAQSNDAYFNGISGYVSYKGTPLEGATIKIIPEGYYTTSEKTGFFSFKKNISPKSQVIITSIGLEKVTLAVSKNMQVVMEAAKGSLEEVVVTGYQTLNQRTNTGSVATISAADLTQVGAMSVDQMLEGKLAGMTISSTFGNPGNTPKIRVRGTSSITGDQEPLWVVDGVIYEEPVNIRNRDLASLDQLNELNMVGGSVAGVNPKDIESISVLKDAAATAIYGVRAANGVIIVTTKKGQEGPTRISYSNNFNIRQRPYYSQYNLMNSAERVRTSIEMFQTGNLTYTFPGPSYIEGAIADLHLKKIDYKEFNERELYFAQQNTDWFDLLFRNAVSNSHTANLSGGSKNSSYYITAGYYDEQANAKDVSLKRYNISARFTNQITSRLKTDIKVGFNSRKNISYLSSANPYDYAVNTNRALPAFDADGNRYFYEVNRRFDVINGSDKYYTFNMQHELEQTGSTSDAKEMNAMLSLNYKIFPWLNVDAMGAYNNTRTLADQWATESSYAIALGGFKGVSRGFPLGQYTIGDDRYEKSIVPFGGGIVHGVIDANNYTFRNQFNFMHQANSDHSISGSLGYEIRSKKYKGNSDFFLGYIPDRGQIVSTPTTTGYKDYLAKYNPVKYTNTINNFVSLYALANYSFKDRYLVASSIRNDGSNIFGKDDRYRYLPVWSLSGKWIASEEYFLKDINWIDHLAIRTSIGTQGNIRSNASANLIVSNNNFDATSGKFKAQVVSLPNPSLRWEKTVSSNIGMEIGLFNNLNIVMEGYLKRSKDLITDKTVSGVTGRNSVLINSDEMENKGFEISLIAYPIKNKNFSWQTYLTGGRNFNKIVTADDAEAAMNVADYRTALMNGNSRLSGDKYGTFYAYRFTGLNEKGWPTFQMKDGTTGHMAFVSEVDYYPLGSSEPKLAGGFDNTFRYKNFNLRLSLTYSFGSYKRLSEYYDGTGPRNFQFDANYSREFLQRWQNPGDENHTNYPVLMDILTQSTLPTGPHYTPTENGFMWNMHNAQGIHMNELYNYSDIRTVKGDYVRLRAINFGYTLPQSWLKKAKIQSLSIQFSAQNIWYWTPEKDKLFGRDPETIGYDYAMPVPKIFDLGLNIVL